MSRGVGRMSECPQENGSRPSYCVSGGLGLERKRAGFRCGTDRVLLKAVCFLLALAAWGCVAVWGQEPARMYVKDQIEVTFRSGPGTEYRILAMLSSGAQVDVLEKGDLWSRVRTTRGEEGWVLNQWLVGSMPLSVRAERLIQENKELKSAGSRASSEIASLREENTQLKGELSEATASRDQLEAAFAGLQLECREFTDLKSRYHRLESRFHKLESESVGLRQEMSVWAQRNRWMLYGGAIFLAGLLTGVLFRRTRGSRKRGLL